MPWKTEGKITEVPLLYIKVSDSGIWTLKDTVVPKQIKNFEDFKGKECIYSYPVKVAESYTTYTPSFFKQQLN